MGCIKEGKNRSNILRAKYLVHQGYIFGRIWEPLIETAIAPLATDVFRLYKFANDVDTVKDQLDGYDNMYSRDNGESLVRIVDTLRYTAYFSTVSRLTKAYEMLTKSKHSPYITKIIPELNSKF